MPAWLQMDTDVSVSSGSTGRSSILKQFGGALGAETNDGLTRLTVALMKDSSEAPGGREPNGFTVRDGGNNNGLSGTGGH